MNRRRQAMNYKLTAITFRAIDEAYSFIAKENHKWVVVGGKTHQVIRNKNTTVITVVFAKAIVENLPVISEFLSNYLKVIKSKPKQSCLKLLLERYYPYPRVKNSTEMVDFRVPTTEKKVKEFLRDKVDDLSSKIPNETDKEAWHTSLFMIKVSMETEGVKFWRAATRVMEWLEKQEQKYAPV
jgi:hypothetical protein